LKPGHPALEASTQPLGYRGGVNVALTFDLFTLKLIGAIIYSQPMPNFDYPSPLKSG